MSSTVSPAKPGALSYTGRAAEVARLSSVIGLLNVVTLSFYRFWGTTRLRRYFWSHVSYDGVPLEYVGRGSELFVGFLIAIAILIPLLVAYSAFEVFVASQGPAVQGIVRIAYLLVVFYLMYVALYRARRYRLTRTLWRGIRCGQTGSSLGYALRAVAYIALAVITLGLAVPFKNVRLYRYRMNHCWYGNQSFRCEAKAGPLFTRWLVTWLLFIPTLGMIWVWYKAREVRHLVGETSFQSVRFASTLTGGQVFRLFLIYVLVFVGISVVFLAIAFGALAVAMGLVFENLSAISTLFLDPVYLAGAVVWYLLYFVTLATLHTTFFMHRLIAMVCRSLTIVGEPDYQALKQSDRAVPGFGEGLADALGTGGI